MPPTRIEKLRAHASRLLDLFIEVKERHALLNPLSERGVVRRFAAGTRQRGFFMLKTTLGMSCVLDLTKLAADKDKRTPSIRRLVEALDDQQLVNQLREDFAVLNIVPKSGYTQDVLDLLEKSERRDEARRRLDFDNLVDDVRSRWNRTEASSTLASFQSLRDQFLAHNELHHDGTDYKPLDIAALGLKWTDIDNFLHELQPQVDGLTLVYRGASFAFDMLDEQVQTAGNSFWTPNE